MLLLAVVLLLLLGGARAVEGEGPVSVSQAEGAGAGGRDVVTWTQSQHGTYNLHLTLKDVQILAVLNSDNYDDEDGDYDYYDYEDPDSETDDTTKPPSTPEGSTEGSSSSEETSEITGPGPRPSESSTAGNMSQTAALNSTHNNTKPASEGAVPTPLLTFESNGKPENITQLPNDPARRAALLKQKLYARRPPTTTAAPITCEPGFMKDRLGRCRKLRKRRPALFPFFRFPRIRIARMRKIAPKHNNDVIHASPVNSR